MYCDPSGNLAITISITTLLMAALIATLTTAVVVIEVKNHVLSDALQYVTTAISNASMWLAVKSGNLIYSSLSYLLYSVQGYGLAETLNYANDGSGFTIPTIMDNFLYGWQYFEKNINPDPFSRPGQIKQNRELKNKSRTKEGFESRYRNGRKPPKKHTPGRDHIKKLWLIWLLEKICND